MERLAAVGEANVLTSVIGRVPGLKGPELAQVSERSVRPFPGVRRFTALRTARRAERELTRFSYVESPVGPLLIAADDEGLRALEFHASRNPVARDANWRKGDHPLIDLARRQLEEYFARTRRTFDLPLAPEGTDFQRTVWLALAEIPYGRTISYSELAARVGRPRAVRAAGAANGRNPLPIVLPCHRVIGADGSLTGFGGGLPMKRFLLELEGALPQVGSLIP